MDRFLCRMFFLIHFERRPHWVKPGGWNTVWVSCHCKLGQVELLGLEPALWWGIWASQAVAYRAQPHCTCDYLCNLKQKQLQWNVPPQVIPFKVNNSVNFKSTTFGLWPLPQLILWLIHHSTTNLMLGSSRDSLPSPAPLHPALSDQSSALSPWIGLLWTPHINGVIQHAAFCDWWFWFIQDSSVFGSELFFWVFLTCQKL